MTCDQQSRFSDPEHIINKGKNLKLPASTSGFLKPPNDQSDKPANRAGRRMDGREVRSAEIYTSVARERRAQAHVNRKR